MWIETALAASGGTARWLDLVAAGVPGPALTRAVAKGRVDRPHRGCYALPGTPRATVLATVFRGQLSCVTWAASVGLPVEVRPTLVHLAVPESRGLGLARLRPDAEVVLHRVGVWPQEFRWTHLDVASLCTTPIQQLALVDAALARGELTRADLATFRYGDQRRRRWLVRAADARAQSLGETYLRVALREAGLRVVPQARIGSVGAVDLLVEDGLVVEVDGFAYHSDSSAFAADRIRDRDLALAGFVTARFTHAEVVESLPEVVGDVLALAWRRGLTPPPARELRTGSGGDTPSGEPMWWR